MGLSKKLISRSFIFIVVLLIGLTINYNVYASDGHGKYNVLIIHSYHKGFTWTDSIHDGFVKEIKKSNLDIDYYTEYLDWKRYPVQANLDNMFNLLKLKYYNKKIDLIATSDDAALKFALKYRKNIFSNAPIVFSGVNKESAFLLTKDYTNVIGDLETINPEGTIEIAQKLNKALKKIYVVFDNTESGLSTGKIVMDAIKKEDPSLIAIPLNNKTHTEIIDLSKKVSKDSMFLLTTYYTDKSGKSIDFEAFCKILSSSSIVPIYSLYDFNMNNGAIGGSMASGNLSGLIEGQLAIKILKGEKPSSLEIEDIKIYRNIFDYNELKKYKIELSLLPKNSTIINKPFSFFETYRALVIATLSAFIVLLIFIFILVFYINRIRKMKSKLEESEERLWLVLDAANDGIWDWNAIEDTYFFSDRWFELLGYDKNKFKNTIGTWENLIHPDDIDIMFNTKLKYFENKDDHYECEFRLRMNDGNYKWIHTRGKALFQQNGKPYRMSGAHVDISKLKEYQSMLEYSAYHDDLTGLYNRRYLTEEIEKHLKIIKDKNYIEAMLFIDIDNFKLINDTMGHATGDKLLCLIAEKLSKDENEDCVLFRLGGDEFIFYLKNQTNNEEINQFVEKVQRSFSEPISLSGRIINPTVSIGISLYPEDGEDVSSLLRYADIAMYKAKNAGKNSFHFYNHYMNTELIERVNIEHQMREGLKNGEFELYYQPLVNTKTQSVEGFEALIRWNNLELGNVTPTKFIPIAEETGFIITLGDWILRESCRFIKSFNSRYNSRSRININISVMQLVREDFLDKLFNILDEIELQNKYVELEITESVIIESPELVAEKIQFLRSCGISVAMDDFGTGYSSLAYLKNIPISTLKIDKSFIDSIKSRDQKNILTDSIIELGHKMSLIMVAEGVEDIEQYEFLKKHNCDLIQGYYFYKPMSVEVLEKELKMCN